jgi:hypothetical protein
MRPSPYGDVLQPFPYSTALKGLMTAVRILRFLQYKNLQLKNGMAVVFSGVLRSKTPKGQTA